MTSFQRAHSEEQREVRRRAILAAAAEMLAEMPVAQVTLSELSRRAGLAKSNVLRYFESREAVLLEMLNAESRHWLDGLDTELAAVDTDTDTAAAMAGREARLPETDAAVTEERDGSVHSDPASGGRDRSAHAEAAAVGHSDRSAHADPAVAGRGKGATDTAAAGARSAHADSAAAGLGEGSVHARAASVGGRDGSVHADAVVPGRGKGSADATGGSGRSADADSVVVVRGRGATDADAAGAESRDGAVHADAVVPGRGKGSADADAVVPGRGRGAADADAAVAVGSGRSADAGVAVAGREKGAADGDVALALRGDRLADALARSLAARPVLCDLSSAQAAVLEHNVSPEAAARYKHAAVSQVSELGGLLRKRLPELSEHAGTRLAALTIMVAGAVWTHSHPGAAVRAVYETDPVLAQWRMDFTSGLRDALEVLIAGVLSRRDRTPSSS
ncbi:TetR family transcriptional regulator [Amycolatopsis saalfeldensis]|uniref:Regulatory protein, tetR family n=1 Tax=Amycolatopsis saalfeldensis TaxID=394193 RepID=A0A1H8PT76_9PSEU|nr:regulatory protein, tetR family [Amycolatopsis saalfeldensis]